MLSKFYYTNMFVIMFATSSKISFLLYILTSERRFKRFKEKKKNVWYKYLDCRLKI